MKRIGLLMCAICAMLMVACGPNRDETVAEISAYEDQLHVLALDETKADSLITMYSNFADNFEKDSLAPKYLMRAADIMTNIGRCDEAIKYLDRIIDNYPEFEDLAGCYFLKGYAYEQAEEYDLAREAYTYFVQTYPNHVLANDTRTMLPYLGLSPEEMLDMLLDSDSIVAENLREN